MGHFSFVILILSTMTTISFSAEMKIVHEWKYLDYVWNNPEQKENATNFGIYKVNTLHLHDVDKADDGRIFATVPVILDPVPASLVTISDKIGPGGPLLRPYPDWSWYNNSDMCDNIINPYNVHIRCNHIFVLDNGYGANKTCDPKLLIFNLENNKLVKAMTIPPDVATNNKTGFGFLVNPFVYVPGKCNLDEMTVFISDMIGSGLVVYDSSKNHLCRVESDFMRATEHLNVTIGNQTIIFMGDIYSSTTIGDDLLYSPLTDKKVYKMKIKELVKCPNKETANNQTKLVGELPTQSGPLASTECSLFLHNYQQLSIQGTNACKQFYSKDVVVLTQAYKQLEVVTGLKTLQYHNELMALSSTYNSFFSGMININESNFFIVKWNLTEIQKNVHSFYKMNIYKKKHPSKTGTVMHGVVVHVILKLWHMLKKWMH